MAELTKLGRYQLRHVLGRGAMGVVYEGFDPTLNRRVAVKTILKSVALDEATQRDYSARFVREAQAVGRLNHPHIVQVYDFGEQDEVAYLVMEFIEGRELRACFDESMNMGTAEAVRIMRELLDALDFAHGKGVIHRDVKPANVMLDTQRQVKLADFGVARLQDSERSAAGTLVGTPAFMSPEQISGGKIDRRTDLFSAGVILYQLLTGTQPFKAEGAWTVVRKIMQEDPPPPSSLVRSVSPVFDEIVSKALAKKPADRYASAREFRAALRAVQRGMTASRAQSGNLVAPAPPLKEVPKASDAKLELKRALPSSSDAAERKPSYLLPAVALVVAAVGASGAYFLLDRKAAPAPVAEIPTPAPAAKLETSAADLERVRRETEERIRREYADKAAAEKAALETAAAAGKLATEKAAAEKAAAEKARLAAEKVASAKSAQEKAELEKLAALEKATAEKAAAAERAAVAAERAAAERLAAAEKAAKAATEKAADEKAARAAAERATEEKAAAARAAAKAAEAAKVPALPSAAATSPVAAPREAVLAGRFAFRLMPGSGLYAHCEQIDVREDIEISSGSAQSISGRDFSDLQFRGAEDGSVAATLQGVRTSWGTGQVRLAGRASATGYAGTYQFLGGAIGCAGQWTLVRKSN